jgi:hypothetical protein
MPVLLCFVRRQSTSQNTFLLPIDDELFRVDQRPQQVAQAGGGVRRAGQVAAGDGGLALVRQPAERPQVGLADQILRLGQVCSFTITFSSALLSVGFAFSSESSLPSFFLVGSGG